MTNKQTVVRYLDGFNAGDHDMILSCLTDDVVWELPGMFLLKGKKEFDKEIENPAFEGRPGITLIRMIEEGNIVVAEGTVTGAMKDGGKLDAVFCDVFHFREGKVFHLTSYLMNRKPSRI